MNFTYTLPNVSLWTTISNIGLAVSSPSKHYSSCGNVTSTHQIYFYPHLYLDRVLIRDTPNHVSSIFNNNTNTFHYHVFVLLIKYLHYNSHNRSRKQKVIFHTAIQSKTDVHYLLSVVTPNVSFKVLLKNSNLPWHVKHLTIFPPLLIRCVTYS